MFSEKMLDNKIKTGKAISKDFTNLPSGKKTSFFLKRRMRYKAREIPVRTKITVFFVVSTEMTEDESENL